MESLSTINGCTNFFITGSTWEPIQTSSVNDLGHTANAAASDLLWDAHTNRREDTEPIARASPLSAHPADPSIMAEEASAGSALGTEPGTFGRRCPRVASSSRHAQPSVSGARTLKPVHSLCLQVSDHAFCDSRFFACRLHIERSPHAASSIHAARLPDDQRSFEWPLNMQIWLSQQGQAYAFLV